MPEDGRRCKGKVCEQEPRCALAGADILVLAVQREVNSFGVGISEVVGRTVEWVEGILFEIFS